jgi:hypothetical protein
MIKVGSLVRFKNNTEINEVFIIATNLYGRVVNKISDDDPDRDLLTVEFGIICGFSVKVSRRSSEFIEVIA